jgi:hypothetical protein
LRVIGRVGRFGGGSQRLLRYSSVRMLRCCSFRM